MDIKVNTSTVTIKTVPLTRSVVKQLDVIHSYNKSDFEAMEFVGRISGSVFGSEYDYEFVLTNFRGVMALLPLRYEMKSHFAHLPKLVL